MTDENLISDDLLRTLVGVGQVDVMVGVPTLNHAATIRDVVRAVDASFRTHFSRQRTLFINSDAGSTDGTQAIINDCCTDPARTVTTSLGLRTVHRISAPYHGMPGKGHVVRMMFAAADLLQTTAVVILDPDVSNITPEWVAALAAPVRNDRFDFVAPVYRRAPAEGLLVTQFLRPLISALYGYRVNEPLVGEFGCSGRFAGHCLEHLAWSHEMVQNGSNLWLTGTALSGPFKTGQAWLGQRTLSSDAPHPALRDLFPQLVAASFSMIETHEKHVLDRGLMKDLPMVNAMPIADASGDTASPVDATTLLQSFSSDVQNLDEILGRILAPETLAAVSDSATGPNQRGLSGELWATIVGECLVAFHHNVMRRDHIAQALLPLYLARTGGFFVEQSGQVPPTADAARNSLEACFEQVRLHIVDRWPAPAVR